MRSLAGQRIPDEAHVSTMQLTPEGRKRIQEIARRNQVSAEAVTTLLEAVVQGNGTMAQFSIAELGGVGQWMRGGMTMIGDMFNHALKAKVDALCRELSDLLNDSPISEESPSMSQSQSQSQSSSRAPRDVPAPTAAAVGNTARRSNLFVQGTAAQSKNWWPDELGTPNATGSQNNMRYAYFAGPRRLALDLGGEVSVYDTLDHQIGGVSQQQSGGSSIKFSSQHGPIDIASLPQLYPAKAVSEPLPREQTESKVERRSGSEDVISSIERLAKLHKSGALTEEEFQTKKRELLARL